MVNKDSSQLATEEKINLFQMHHIGMLNQLHGGDLSLNLQNKKKVQSLAMEIPLIIW